MDPNLRKSNYTFNEGDDRLSYYSGMSQLDLSQQQVEDLKRKNKKMKNENHRLKKIQAGWSTSKTSNFGDIQFLQ